MNKKFQKIWNIALPYQDKRDDKGHAQIVTKFAEKILKSEEGNMNVVIPTAILHDIGWSQIPVKKRMSLFNLTPGSAQDKKLRIIHQIKGVKLAGIILKKINYDKNLTGEICKIISQHDTRNNAFNLNDAILQDADKLWQFSKKGFTADLIRRGVSGQEWSKHLNKTINKLHTKVAKKIAKKELSLRLA